MKRIRLVLTVALVMATMMVAMAAPAFAAPPPESPHGTCGLGETSGGAAGCAGNIGGFIITEHQGCREINRGPFFSSEFFSCPNSGSRVSIGPALY